MGSLVLFLNHYSLSLPWFAGVSTLMPPFMQPNGDPLHVEMYEYLTHYEAYVVEVDMKVEGDYTQFADRTQHVIELGLLAVKLQEIFSTLLLIKTIIFGLFTFARRL